MKKYIAILVCLAALLVAGVVCASAATQESGYWVENAKNIDEMYQFTSSTIPPHLDELQK